MPHVLPSKANQLKAVACVFLVLCSAIIVQTAIIVPANTSARHRNRTISHKVVASQRMNVAAFNTREGEYQDRPLSPLVIAQANDALQLVSSLSV